MMQNFVNIYKRVR